MRTRKRSDGNVGHEGANLAIEVEVRMFNSITRYAKGLGHRRRLSLKPGGTVGDVLSMLGIPPAQVFLVLVNGRDITPGLIGGRVRTSRRLEHGDVVALSGPVPYTWK